MTPPAVTRHTKYADLPELLDAAEVVAYTGLSRGSVYELIRRGELQHLRFGRRVLVPKTALRPEQAGR